MDPNNAWQAYYNRFGGQEQGMVGNPASLLLAHQQLREAANQVGSQNICLFFLKIYGNAAKIYRKYSVFMIN